LERRDGLKGEKGGSKEVSESEEADSSKEEG
jgi:hypothetical protein